MHALRTVLWRVTCCMSIKRATISAMSRSARPAFGQLHGYEFMLCHVAAHATPFCQGVGIQVLLDSQGLLGSDEPRALQHWANCGYGASTHTHACGRVAPAAATPCNSETGASRRRASALAWNTMYREGCTARLDSQACWQASAHQIVCNNKAASTCKLTKHED